MENSKKMVEQHRQTREIEEIVIYPEHAQRKESKEFKESKKRLKEDGHYKCWICGATENLQVHHFGAEWALANDCDFDKLKDFLLLFDVYGYSNLLKDKPLTSPDDIRNMMVLCEEHHTKKIRGIHETTFPIWQAQKWYKSYDPVPDKLKLKREDGNDKGFWNRLCRRLRG